MIERIDVVGRPGAFTQQTGIDKITHGAPGKHFSYTPIIEM
jgi:hypothetical protein